MCNLALKCVIKTQKKFVSKWKLFLSCISFASFPGYDSQPVTGGTLFIYSTTSCLHKYFRVKLVMRFREFFLSALIKPSWQLNIEKSGNLKMRISADTEEWPEMDWENKRQNYTLQEQKGIVSSIIDEKIKFKKT